MFLAVLLVSIIQSLFRKAKSFNPGTSLCPDRDDFVQNIFRQRFIAKAVWACLVLAFFVSYLVPWRVFRKAPEETRKNRVKIARWQRAKSSVAYNRGKSAASLNLGLSTDEDKLPISRKRPGPTYPGPK